MIDRRKFLERSVLSTGSVIFSSALLQSCTKYGIPLPGRIPHPGGNTPPLTGDDNIDWNGDAKTAVSAGLQLVPEVGGFLSALVDIFWPVNKPSVWDQVKDQVEAVVNQKISDATYTLVSADLAGLHDVLTIYQNEVKNGNSAEILSKWDQTRSLFAAAAPHFYMPGDELPLIGLFVQFANMRLSLLRDAVIDGVIKSGRSDADQQQDVIDLQALITDYVKYIQRIYEVGNTNLIANTPIDYIHHLEPFRTLNAYNRQMTLMVFDYAQAWPYYDATLYPNGGTVVYTREIFSDPYGTCDDSGSFRLQQIQSKQFPTNLTVWANDYVESVQLTYPQGGGPGGVTQTPRMGDSSEGSNQPPYGGSFNLSPDNPIIQAKVAYDGILRAVQFGFYDGTTTNILGGGYYVPSNFTEIDYTNEALSSVYINGVSYRYGSADCVVFGFKYWQSPAVTLNAIRTLYVKSPKEYSMADFAQAFPNLALPANLITEELKAARQAYWTAIKASAAEIG